jgi:hypothetical protein
VNYFEQELVPWVHYIPVNSNLSDIVEKAAYVADPANDEAMKLMVQRANEWCRSKMTVTQFGLDMLWILISYLNFLHESDDVRDQPWLHQFQWEDFIDRYDWVGVADE